MKFWRMVGLIALGAGCAACSSTTVQPSGTSASGGTGGTSGGGGGGGGMDGSQSTALVGTWDVVSALGGSEAIGVITVSATDLDIDWAPLSLHASMANGVPSITGSWRETTTPITATRTSTALDLGQIPYGVGGSWVLQGQKADRCNVLTSSTAVSLDCSNLTQPLATSLQGWDYEKGESLATGISTAQRTAQLDSVFGDLGGLWTVVLPRGNCTVTIQNNTLDAACTRVENPDKNETKSGELTLTFTDGFASGTSSVGEVSAKRR